MRRTASRRSWCGSSPLSPLNAAVLRSSFEWSDHSKGRAKGYHAAMASSGPTELRPPPTPKGSHAPPPELRERILGGHFPAGSPLPPERVLAQQTEMSRTTVREALRILEV